MAVAGNNLPIFRVSLDYSGVPQATHSSYADRSVTYSDIVPGSAGGLKDAIDELRSGRTITLHSEGGQFIKLREQFLSDAK